MPLHLESIVRKDKEESIVLQLEKDLRSAECVFSSSDRTIFHVHKPMIDRLMGEAFGTIVYTLQSENRDAPLKLIDVDLVLHNDRITEMLLLTKHPKSSDANEYYDAEVVGEGGHLQIETVNRQAIDEEIENTVQKISASAFPFRVSIHNSMDEFNKKAGFGKDMDLDESMPRLLGFAEHFMAPASMFQMGAETYTYFFGKVQKIREVEWEGYEEAGPILIVDVDSGMGVIPVAMNRECFDLEELAEGKVLELRADVKANLGIGQ